jgi:hypothetical protein
MKQFRIPLWLGWLINYTRTLYRRPTNEITRDAKSQKVNFEWLLNKKWNSIYVETTASKVEKSFFRNSYLNIIMVILKLTKIIRNIKHPSCV